MPVKEEALTVGGDPLNTVVGMVLQETPVETATHAVKDPAPPPQSAAEVLQQQVAARGASPAKPPTTSSSSSPETPVPTPPEEAEQPSLPFPPPLEVQGGEEGSDSVESIGRRMGQSTSTFRSSPFQSF